MQNKGITYPFPFYKFYKFDYKRKFLVIIVALSSAAMGALLSFEKQSWVTPKQHNFFWKSSSNNH